MVVAAPDIALLEITRVPTLEPVLDAVEGWLLSPLWDEAAAAVLRTLGDTDVRLERPAQCRRVNADGFGLPTDWPGIMLMGHNLRRVDAAGEDSALGGFWRGLVEFHCWLLDDVEARLVRSLHAYASVIWLILCSADAQGALAGAWLEPETMGWNRYAEPGQSQAQQAVSVLCEFGLRA